eukprot:scaffold649165_cov48-Prasinocladus_malaysianus.AAC.1
MTSTQSQHYCHIAYVAQMPCIDRLCMGLLQSILAGLNAGNACHVHQVPEQERSQSSVGIMPEQSVGGLGSPGAGQGQPMAWQDSYFNSLPGTQRYSDWQQ